MVSAAATVAKTFPSILSQNIVKQLIRLVNHFENL